METTTSPLESLQLQEQAQLLNAIDGVRALGIGHEIPLPQLIVVGDQSSGKSSVLEAISGVKFPVDQGTTTRFATEIILRHSNEVTASVRLITSPGTNIGPGKIARVSEGSDGALADVPFLIEQTRKMMGVHQGFSRDILQLHISGPTCPHLTLVDLPGLVRNPEKGMTMDDAKLVEEVVAQYMGERRSIILVVVEATRDAGTQDIIRLAAEADSEGARTIGIITKPDRAKPGSLPVQEYINRARGISPSKFSGWHVVRNADFNERDDPNFNREAKEQEDLSKPPWNQLMPEWRGTENLRRRLSERLLEHIRTEMPAVISEISDARRANEQDMKRLGEPRASPVKQREYLTKIGEDYQRLVRDSANGMYKDTLFFDDDPTKRLRLRLRRCAETFLFEMIQKGHTHVICWHSQLHDSPSVNAMARLAWESDLMKLIYEKLSLSRGWELPGSFDPSVVNPVFKAMTEKWVEKAKEYADNVYETTSATLEAVLGHKCEPETFRTIWNNTIEPELEKRHARLLSKIEELSLPYTRCHPFTFSPRLDAMQSQISKLFEHGVPCPPGVVEADMDITACKRVFVQVQAIYQIALETFIDNMTLIAVENELVHGLEDIFAPSHISTMTDDELNELASESKTILTRRQFLEQQRNDLSIALQACKRHRSNIVRERRVHETTSATAAPASRGSTDNDNGNDSVSASPPPSQISSTPFTPGRSATSTAASSPQHPSRTRSRSPPPAQNPSLSPSSNPTIKLLPNADDDDNDDSSSTQINPSNTPPRPATPSSSSSSSLEKSSTTPLQQEQLATPTTTPTQHRRRRSRSTQRDPYFSSLTGTARIVVSPEP